MCVYKMLKAVIVTFIFFVFFRHSAQAETAGSFTVVKGDIQVQSKDGKAEKAKIGKKVIPSDTIIAGKDSRAKIVMIDKNIINISPETKMVLEKYIYEPGKDDKQVSLSVTYGKVRATVEQKYDGEKNKFQIKTPSVVAGVRGTDFLTSYSLKNKETKIITFEGKVAVGSPGPGGQILNPVMVSKGEMTTAASGSPPAPPAPVPAEEFKQMSQDSTADSKGSDSNSSGATKEPNDAKDSESDEKKKSSSESGESGEKAKEDSNKKEESPKSKESAQAEEPKKSDEGQKKEDARKTIDNKGEALASKDASGENKSSEVSRNEDPQKPSESAPNSQRDGDSNNRGQETSASKGNQESSTPNRNQDTASVKPENSTKGSGQNSERGPASTPASRPSSTTTMLDRSDLAPSVSKEVVNPNLQPNITVPGSLTAPPATNQATQQYVNQVNQIIRNNNTNSKLNVIIKRAP